MLREHRWSQHDTNPLLTLFKLVRFDDWSPGHKYAVAASSSYELSVSNGSPNGYLILKQCADNPRAGAQKSD